MAILNLEIAQGGTFTNEFFVSDPITGTLNLTGFVAKAQMRRSYKSVNPTVEFPVAIQDPIAGKVVMALDKTATEAIKAGRYVWDLELTSPGNPDEVRLINVDTEGSGYTTATVIVSGGEGAGATGTAVITSGKITSVTVTNVGSGYTTDPLIQISGDGIDAAIFAVRGARVERILEGTITVTPEVTKI